MVEKTEITRPIEIKDNSKERIAYDLMDKIASSERGSGQSFVPEVLVKQRNREYWLKLYNQCYRVIDYKDINIEKLLSE